MRIEEQKPAEKIAAEAERVLRTVRYTDFVHEPTIDPDTHTYKLDSSAFVSFLLESAAPAALARIPTTANQPIPCAKAYCNYFLTRPHREFVNVDKLRDTRRGDIIAWTDAKVARSKERGHVAVVADCPTFHAEENLWTMTVYDASAVPHFDDSRQRGDRFHPGVGSGALKIRADSKGAPIAVQVGPRLSCNKLRIAVGRLVNPTPDAAVVEHGTPPDAMRTLGCRVHRSAVMNESLGHREFAIATYVLASGDGMLLVPTTVAYWGPGQAVPQSVGRGAATYQFAGGVVFRSD